jgi:hypothetical protein
MTAVIIVTFQLSALFFFFYFFNRNKHKKIESFIQKIKKDTLLERKQLKCNASMFGGSRKASLYFKHCDLYLTNKALIIIGNSKLNLFNKAFSPVVLSKESKIIHSDYLIFEPITGIYRNRNKNLTLKFGNIYEAEVELSFSGLLEHEINMIENLFVS